MNRFVNLKAIELFGEWREFIYKSIFTIPSNRTVSLKPVDDFCCQQALDTAFR